MVQLSTQFYLVLLFGCHATCSVSMTLLNKTLMQRFEYAWFVIFVQNLSTVLLGFLYPAWKRFLKALGVAVAGGAKDQPVRKLRTFLGIKVPSKGKNKLLSVLQCFLSSLVLFVSLRALKFVSVPLYVVARNCVPALTAFMERVLNNTVIPPVGILGIAFTITGAIIFNLGDTGNTDIEGVVWAVMTATSVALCSVADKMIVKTLADEEGLAPVEVNQQRFALSLPGNALLIYGLEIRPEHLGSRPPVTEAVWSMTPGVIASLVLTSFFGFGMGTCNFYLQQATTAATVQVANIGYKLATTMISRVTHPAPVPMISWVGFILSTLGIVLYTFKPNLRLMTSSKVL